MDKPYRSLIVAGVAALLALCGALIPSSCARADTAPANPADAVSCYWSTHHSLCLCSANWHDQNPMLVLTPAKTAKSCL